MYHEHSRALQDRYDTRRLADRLPERLSRTAFSDEDRAFIESRAMFFLATADDEGRPDCSYKGGMPGFVRVVDERIFPNCPRCIHRMQLLEHSPYAPGDGRTPPAPEWKKSPQLSDVLPK